MEYANFRYSKDTRKLYILRKHLDHSKESFELQLPEFKYPPDFFTMLDVILYHNSQSADDFFPNLLRDICKWKNDNTYKFLHVCGKPNIATVITQQQLMYFVIYTWILGIVGYINQTFYHQLAIEYKNLPVCNLNLDIDEIQDLEKAEPDTQNTDFKNSKQRSFNIEIVRARAQAISDVIVKELGPSIIPTQVSVCVTSRKYTNSFHYAVYLPMGRMTHEVLNEKIKSEISSVLGDKFKLDVPCNAILPFGRQHFPVLKGNLEKLGYCEDKKSLTWTVMRTCTIFPLILKTTCVLNYGWRVEKIERRLAKRCPDEVRYVVVPLAYLHQNDSVESDDDFDMGISENFHVTCLLADKLERRLMPFNHQNYSFGTTMQQLCAVVACNWISSETLEFIKLEERVLLFWEQYTTSKIKYNIENFKLTPLDFVTASENKLYNPTGLLMRRFQNSFSKDTEEVEVVEPQCATSVDGIYPKIEKHVMSVTDKSIDELQDIWEQQTEYLCSNFDRGHVYVLSHPVFHNDFINYPWTEELWGIVLDMRQQFLDNIEALRERRSLVHIVRNFLAQQSTEWVMLLLALVRFNHRLKSFGDEISQFVVDNNTKTAFRMLEKENTETMAPLTEENLYKTINDPFCDVSGDDNKHLVDVYWMIEIVYDHINNFNAASVIAALATAQKNPDNSQSIIDVISALLEFPFIEEKFTLNKNALFKLFSYITVPINPSRFNNYCLLRSYIRPDFLYFQARLFFVTEILKTHATCYIDEAADAQWFYENSPSDFRSVTTLVSVYDADRILKALGFKLTLPLFSIVMEEVCCVFKMDKAAMVFGHDGYTNTSLPSLHKNALNNMTAFPLINYKNYEFFTSYGCIVNSIFDFKELATPANFVITSAALEGGENMDDCMFFMPHNAYSNKLFVDILMKLPHFLRMLHLQQLLTICLSPLVPVTCQTKIGMEVLDYRITNFTVMAKDLNTDICCDKELATRIYDLRNVFLTTYDCTNDEEDHDKDTDEDTGESYEDTDNSSDATVYSNDLNKGSGGTHVSGKTGAKKRRRKRGGGVKNKRPRLEDVSDKYKLMAHVFLNLVVYLSTLSFFLKIPNTVMNMLFHFFKSDKFSMSCFPQMEKMGDVIKYTTVDNRMNSAAEHGIAGDVVDNALMPVDNLTTHILRILHRMPGLFDIIDEAEVEHKVKVPVDDELMGEGGDDGMNNDDDISKYFRAETCTGPLPKRFITYQKGSMDVDLAYTLTNFSAPMFNFESERTGRALLGMMKTDPTNLQWYTNIFILLTWFVRSGPVQHAYYDTPFFKFVRTNRQQLYDEIADFLVEITGPVLKMRTEYLPQYLYEFVDNTTVEYLGTAYRMPTHQPAMALESFYAKHPSEQTLIPELYPREYVETKYEYRFSKSAFGTIIHSYSDMIALSGFNMEFLVIALLDMATLVFRRNIYRELFLFKGLSSSGKTTLAQSICDMLSSKKAPYRMKFKNASGDINTTALSMAFNLVTMCDDIAEVLPPEMVKILINAHGTNESRDIHASKNLSWAMNSHVIATSNFYPRPKTEDEAFLRRIKILPFDHRFVPVNDMGRDRFNNEEIDIKETGENLGGQLLEKAYEATSNVSTMCLMMFKFLPQLFFNTFDCPIVRTTTRVMREIMKRYQIEVSPVTRFYSEHVFSESDNKISRESLRRLITEWFENNKTIFAFTPTALSQNVRVILSHLEEKFKGDESGIYIMAMEKETAR